MSLYNPRHVGSFVVEAPLLSAFLVLAALPASENAMAADPDLEPGFPVQSLDLAGTAMGSPVINTLVGNMDGDPRLEIVVTGLAIGPLYAWKWNGSPVPGWPLGSFQGAGYGGMGKLSNAYPGLQVFAGYWGQLNQLGQVAAYSPSESVLKFTFSPDIRHFPRTLGHKSPPVAYLRNTVSGTPLPGWPQASGNYVTSPPALADVNGDGLDEIFIAEEDWCMHAYKANGASLSGWPVCLAQWGFGQRLFTPAIGDLDGNGSPEIVMLSDEFSSSNCSGNGCQYVFVYRTSGMPVKGFPVKLNCDVACGRYPVVGDVDGDGSPEIIVGGESDNIAIVSASGVVERTVGLAEPYNGVTHPVLADMTGDGIPEIIVETANALNVLRGDGSAPSGWPVVWDGSIYLELGNTQPVVGDVTGDGLPDIVMTLVTDYNINQDEVRVYDRNGVLDSHFPKTLYLGAAAVPAIADLAQDGHNDIIVTSHYWDGNEGYHDKVWVFDLGGPPHGRIEWGQFGGGPRHQGFYQPFYKKWLYLPLMAR